MTIKTPVLPQPEALSVKIRLVAGEVVAQRPGLPWKVVQP